MAEITPELVDRLVERLERIERKFEQLMNNVDDLKGGINRHDETLYDFLVKPARDKEDKNGR
jgi:predicted  nucleic acid-binding Zn-ribbon protein